MKSPFLLSFALFIGASLFAQNPADFQYTASKRMVTITGYTGSAKNVTIPDRINNLPVTAIGKLAFYKNQLTSVTIPANVDVAGDSFPGNLAQVYMQGGKGEGTYTSGDGGKTWTRQ
jgi:hypothetical protein